MCKLGIEELNMAANLLAAAAPAVFLIVTAFLAIRLNFSRTADPKWVFLNSLIRRFGS
jgi:hypothetical protein